MPGNPWNFRLDIEDIQYPGIRSESSFYGQNAHWKEKLWAFSLYLWAACAHFNTNQAMAWAILNKYGHFAPIWCIAMAIWDFYAWFAQSRGPTWSLHTKPLAWLAVLIKLLVTPPEWPTLTQADQPPPFSEICVSKLWNPCPIWMAKTDSGVRFDIKQHYMLIF